MLLLLYMAGKATQLSERALPEKLSGFAFPHPREESRTRELDSASLSCLIPASLEMCG